MAAALAYRHGIDLIDSRTNVAHHFSTRGRRDEIAAAGFSHGQTVPAWNLDAQSFANALETAETRVNSCIARDVQCALPHELPEPKRIDLARTWAKLIASRYDTPVAYAVHRPDRRGDIRNHHLHVLLPTRSLTPDGSLGNKLRQLDDRRTGPAEIRDVRALWQEHCNTALQDAGLAIRIDTGRTRPPDVPPTPKVGPSATQLERDAAAEHGAAPGASIAETVVSEPQCATAVGAELRRHVLAHQPDFAMDAAEVANVEITLLEDEPEPTEPASPPHQPRRQRAPRAARAPRDPRQREASKRVRLARKALEQAPDDSALQAELAAAKDAQAALRDELRQHRETRSREIDRAAANGSSASAFQLPELTPQEEIPLLSPPEIPEPPVAAMATPDLLGADPPPRLISPTVELSPAIDFSTPPVLDAVSLPTPLPPPILQPPPPVPELLPLKPQPASVPPLDIPEPPEAVLKAPVLLSADPLPPLLDLEPVSRLLPKPALPEPPPPSELPQPEPQPPVAVDPPTPPWHALQQPGFFDRLLRKIHRWWPWAENPPEPEPAVAVVRQVPSPEPVVQPQRSVPVTSPQIRPAKPPKSLFRKPEPDPVISGVAAPQLRPTPDPPVRAPKLKRSQLRQPRAAKPVRAPYPDALRTSRKPPNPTRQSVSRR